MAFGKPTIIADEPGADTESLIDNDTGFRFRKGNVAELVDKVNFALSDDPAVRQIGKKAQAVIRQRFSISSMVSKIHTAILTAIGNTPQVQNDAY